MKTAHRILIASIAFTVSDAPRQAEAAIVQYYDLIGTAGPGLLPGNEPGSISGGTGGEIGAGIFLDDGNDADPNTNFLTISNVGWGSSQGFVNLSSNSSASHIHGPTLNNFGFNGTSNYTQTAGAPFNLTRSSSAVTGGVFTNAPISLTAAQVIDFNNGRYYINIHTTNNTGGELRGFIVPVPEPSSALLAGAGLLGLLGRRRRSLR